VLSGQHEWTCVLGAITGDGGQLFSRFTEYATAECAKIIIYTLCKYFRDDFLIVLDGAPYFQVLAVRELVARDDLESLTLTL
jgi:hypothetical protein